MPYITQMTVTWTGAAAVRKADMKTAGREAMRLAGQLHHKLFKPRKFSPTADKIYKLRRRAPRYRKAKRYHGKNGQGVRAIGVDQPFIWSGTTRNLAMAGTRVIATAPSAERHWVRILFNTPQLNRVPWVREEFERINKNEVETLRKASAKRYERHLNQHGRVLTRRSK